MLKHIEHAKTLGEKFEGGYVFEMSKKFASIIGYKCESCTVLLTNHNHYKQFLVTLNEWVWL